MRMPIFARVIVGALAGVGMIGIAALADSNQKHATTSATTAQVRSQDQILPQPDGAAGHLDQSQDRTRWGWITSPVYEGEDSDDGSVKLSPGKIQRTGVKSEPAAPRVIRTMIHAPGAIQLDERRVSVIAMRAESYIQKVANVTTGAHVVKGQPLMEVYSPAVSSAAAEYISTINSKITGGRRALWPGFAAAADESRRAGCGHRRDGEKPEVPIGIEWTSPRDGIVLERNAIEGMRAQPGDVLFRIADQRWSGLSSTLPSATSVASSSASRATVRARGFPGREFTGQDRRRSIPQINKETRTARVRDRTGQSGTGVAARHVCRCRNRHRQPGRRCWPFPKAR